FLVIAGVHASVGERGMAPDQVATKRVAGRLQNLGATDFLIALGRELGDDEMACLAGQEAAVAVLHDEGGAVGKRLAARGWRESLPEALAGFQLDGPQLALHAATTVNHAVFQERRAVGAIYGVLGSAVPHDLGGRLVGGELEEHSLVSD